jgi:hypothetical protein
MTRWRRPNPTSSSCTEMQKKKMPPNPVANSKWPTKFNSIGDVLMWRLPLKCELTTRAFLLSTLQMFTRWNCWPGHYLLPNGIVMWCHHVNIRRDDQDDSGSWSHVHGPGIGSSTQQTLLWSKLTNKVIQIWTEHGKSSYLQLARHASELNPVVNKTTTAIRRTLQNKQS